MSNKAKLRPCGSNLAINKSWLKQSKAFDRSINNASKAFCAKNSAQRGITIRKSSVKNSLEEGEIKLLSHSIWVIKKVRRYYVDFLFSEQ